MDSLALCELQRREKAGPGASHCWFSANESGWVSLTVNFASRASPILCHATGESIESEPFRLYNLDVFEYEHDSQFGLYGSIPYVISHKPGATVGAFWCAQVSTHEISPQSHVY